MEKPKINAINGFSIFSGVIGIISSFAPSSLWSVHAKLLTGATCLLIVLGYSLFDIYRQATRIYQAYSELNRRHQALANQFDRKSNLVEKYQITFSHLGHCLVTASTILKEEEKSQVNNLYRIYLDHLNNIKGE